MLNISLIIYCIVVVQLLSCVRLCSLMGHNTPGFPVLHHLPDFAQTQVHWFGDAIQPSHSLLPSSSLVLNLSQHQDFLQWVDSSHQGGQGIGFSALSSCLPVHILVWLPLGLTGLISLISRVFSSTYTAYDLTNIFFSCCGLVLLFTSALCSEEYPGLYAFFQFCNIKPAWDIHVLSAGVCNALCGDSHTLSVEAHMHHLGGIQVECWATCHSGGGWLPVRYLMGCGGRPLRSVVSFWDLHSGFLTQVVLPCSYFPQDHSARLTPSMLRKG